MKRVLLPLILIGSIVACAQQKDIELWYKRPATQWYEALPVGNGRLGGMVFGDYKQEHIQLNEESLWAGSKNDNKNPQAKEHLKEGHTGWSKAWIINLYARLLDPEKVMENLNDLLRKSTLSNLFDTHPPFQIDGNFGAAAIAEMLLQSQNNEINLLPALPAQWPEGSIHGLRARGACTINLDWSNRVLTMVSVKSDKGGNYTIRYKDKLKEIKLAPGKSITLNSSLN